MNLSGKMLGEPEQHPSHCPLCQVEMSYYGWEILGGGWILCKSCKNKFEWPKQEVNHDA